MVKKIKKVTISGSFHKYFPEILALRQTLLRAKIQVLSPKETALIDPGEEFILLKGEEKLSPFKIEDNRLSLIRKTDALIVCDPDGYVGPSAFLEIGYAYALKKPIFFTEKPKEFILNAFPFKVGLPKFKKR